MPQALTALLHQIQHQTLATHPAADPIHDCAQDLSKLLTGPDELLHLAERELNVFPFRHVARGWFRLFVDAALGRAVRLIWEGLERERERGSGEWLDEVVAVLDRALIMAGGVGREEVIQRLLGALRGYEVVCLRGGEGVDMGERAAKRRRIGDETPSCIVSVQELLEEGEEEHDDDDDDGDLLPANYTAAPKIEHSVPRLKTPSLTDFQKHMDNVKEPVILTGIMDHWPALKQWKKKSYWMKETFNGRRLVPVEIGRSYTDDDWGQTIMPFGEFLGRYVLDHSEDRPEVGVMNEEAEINGEESSEAGRLSDGGVFPAESGSSPAQETGRPTGYLAQHDLLHQIPSLRSAIATPDYCYLDPPAPEPGTPVYLSRMKEKKKNKNKNKASGTQETKTSHPNPLPAQPSSSPSSSSFSSSSCCCCCCCCGLGMAGLFVCIVVSTAEAEEVGMVCFGQRCLRCGAISLSERGCSFELWCGE